MPADGVRSEADENRYNKADHPIAFHRGDMFAASKKKIADIGPAPDNEDVFEVRPGVVFTLCRDLLADFTQPRRRMRLSLTNHRTRQMMTRTTRSMMSLRIS